MKINVKKEIVDYGQKPIRTGTEENSPNFTLGSMMLTSLNTPVESENKATAETKVHRAHISQKIYNALQDGHDGDVDINHEDIVDIKQLMNNFYGPMHLYRAFEIFDPKVEVVPENAVETKAKK